MYRNTFGQKIPRYKEDVPSPYQIARNLYIVVAFISAQGLGSVAKSQYEMGYTVQFYWIILLAATIFEAVVDRVMEKKIADRFVGITPKMARVRRDGQEVEVPVEDVKVGDVVVVRPGDRVSVDGVVTSGTSAVDQAPITGESIPVEKNIGDEVFAGTVNGMGMLLVQTAKESTETVLSRTIKLVDEAQKAKPKVERFFDKISALFIPVIFVLMGLTTNYHGLATGITVLMVAAPTALLVSVPMAVLATMSKATRQGILIKGGTYIEVTSRLNAMAADKTGTLTQGRCQVTDVIAFGNNGDGRALALAATAEKFSEHPLANAIVSKAKESGYEIPDPENFQALSGLGVVAYHDGSRIIVGRRKLLDDYGVQITKEAEEAIGGLELQGKTLSLVAENSNVVGVIAIADVVRPEAPKAVEQLGSVGISRFIMLTGDNSRTAKTIANQLGINEFYAELLPEQKLDRIKTIRGEGYKIGMIGDGVNDAPALATADVGIAMGVAGSDVAIETANIALMTDDLTRVKDAIEISRRASKTIKWNATFAIIFNIIGIAFAMNKLLTPELAIIANTVSSLVVIGTSARLLR